MVQFGVIRARKVIKPVEQILQSEHASDQFIKWVFVNNHRVLFYADRSQKTINPAFFDEDGRLPPQDLLDPLGYKSRYPQLPGARPGLPDGP